MYSAPIVGREIVGDHVIQYLCRTESQENAGTYTDAITCGQGTLAADNYSFAGGDAADFTINKKQLTVDADPGTKVYGQSDPAFTATLNGFAFGENRATGGVTGAESCSRTGTDEGVGTYNDVLSVYPGSSMTVSDATFSSTTCSRDFELNYSPHSLPYTFVPMDFDDISFTEDCRPAVRSQGFSRAAIRAAYGTTCQPRTQRSRPILRRSSRSTSAKRTC